LLASIILAIDVNWSDFTDPIYELFMGNQTTGTLGIFEGNELLLAGFLFILFLILTLMFGLGLLVGSVILIPASFAIFDFAPPLRIIFAIVAGLIFGLALHRLVRR